MATIPLKRYWTLLVAYLRPQAPQMLLLGALLLTTTGLQLVSPQILRFFIDTAKQGGAALTLIMAASLFLGVGLLTQASSVWAGYVSNSVGWNATNRLRADLLAHCVRLDMSFHNVHTPGELLQRIDGDVSELANFFSLFVLNVVGSLLLLLGVLGALVREDYRLGLAFAAFSVAALLLLNRLRGVAIPYWRASQAAGADLAGFLEERLSAVPDIRPNGAIPYTMRRFYQATRTQFLCERRAGVIGLAIFNATDLVLSLGAVAALAVGAYLFQHASASIGTVYLIVYYAGLLLSPLRTLGSQVDDLQKASASIARIEELNHLQSSEHDGMLARTAPGATCVEFREVSFGYGAEKGGVRNISFRVQPGRVLGLLGRTGSGKTTLTRLLFRLYDPDTGMIELDGVDIRDLRLSDLRRGIGMVTQEVQLFQASVRDNLTFFDRRVPDDLILQMLEELGLSRWYASLPLGLDTELTSGGANLSAGEAQLVAFARIFLKDPALVILDEASSRLDPLTERLIERAVDRLLRNRTGIIIAHRLETLQRADDILILEQGAVREYGSRADLASDSSSRFYELLHVGLEEALR